VRVSFLRLFKWNADARGNEDVPTPAASAHDGVGRLTPSLTDKAEFFFLHPCKSVQSVKSAFYLIRNAVVRGNGGVPTPAAPAR